MNPSPEDTDDLAGAEGISGPSGLPAGPGLADIAQKLEQVLRRLELLPLTPSPAAQAALPDASFTGRSQPLLEKLDMLGQQQRDLVAALGRLEMALPKADRAPDTHADALQSVAPQPEAAAADDWAAAILGRELALLPTVEKQRTELLDALLAGQQGARAMAGQMLVFQAATPEKMPQLLRDLGEACYYWRPKSRPGTSAWEKALAGWAERCCEASGVSIRIELVEPGQRFDATRHHSTSRGVEVESVQGWVVLRDNGKVYTKACVGVR